MPSDKRARQRAAREAKRQAEAKAAKRRALVRNSVIVVVVAAVVVGSILYFTNRSPSKKTKATSTTTTAAGSTAAEQKAANTLATAAGCPATPKTRVNTLTWPTPPPMTIDTAKTYKATVKTTAGTFVITLDAKQAPTTVNSFVFLARQKYFHCVIFHRVIPNFMDQTGDPTGSGTGGPGYKFNNENIPKAYATGDVAMANSGPNTNGSQFFMVVPGGATILDQDLKAGGYSLFGTVSSGMTVVEKINSQGSSGGTPTVTQRMLSVTISTS